MIHIKTFSNRGTHIICDMYGIKPELLDNIQYLHQLGKFSIAKSGMTFVDMVTFKFDPVGCTLLFLLSESHLSFHTSPEFESLFLDIFVCGDSNPEVAVNYIIQELKPDPNRIYKQTIIRGVESVHEQHKISFI